MVNIPWPSELRPRDFSYYHIDTDISGGTGLSGTEQFVVSPGSRWGASMTLQIGSDAGVLAIRAFRAKLKGRANPTLLPNFDGRRVSWPLEALTDRLLTPKTAKILEGTWAMGGTAYAGDEVPTRSRIVATIAVAASVRATQCQINVTQGGPLREGQQFGIFGLRLHEIADVLGADPQVDGSTTYTVNFIPPFRSNVALGTAVQLHRPTCLMRCLNMDEQTKKFEYLRFATLNLEFIEFV